MLRGQAAWTLCIPRPQAKHVESLSNPAAPLSSVFIANAVWDSPSCGVLPQRSVGSNVARGDSSVSARRSGPTCNEESTYTLAGQLPLSRSDPEADGELRPIADIPSLHDTWQMEAPSKRHGRSRQLPILALATVAPWSISTPLAAEVPIHKIDSRIKSLMQMRL